MGNSFGHGIGSCTWCNAVYANFDILVAEVEGQLMSDLH